MKPVFLGDDWAAGDSPTYHFVPLPLRTQSGPTETPREALTEKTAGLDLSHLLILRPSNSTIHHPDQIRNDMTYPAISSHWSDMTRVLVKSWCGKYRTCWRHNKLVCFCYLYFFPKYEPLLHQTRLISRPGVLKINCTQIGPNIVS